eukprot:CAMPEP_0119417542 /NCGR_PEP_ID=MMETSP1335-20130426/16061_1 /TAXON_ID=259385 /ORGANISM="Chrysoculter rhomboideus, Strain RCC1486" /LENGTH=106 /DNA_ID=CAMNT_0007442723 /DNA_START=114 /DNA_END=430 /DNA_ORIENTATION=+
MKDSVRDAPRIPAATLATVMNASEAPLPTKMADAPKRGNLRGYLDSCCSLRFIASWPSDACSGDGSSSPPSTARTHPLVRPKRWCHITGVTSVRAWDADEQDQLAS